MTVEDDKNRAGTGMESSIGRTWPRLGTPCISRGTQLHSCAPVSSYIKIPALRGY